MNRVAEARSMNHGMSTVMTHSAFGKYAQDALKAVCDEAVRLEEMLSCFILQGNTKKPKTSLLLP